MTELSSKFNFKDVEAKWGKIWEQGNLFHAEVDPKKKPYTIVIPPPNVTGILHMGHALNNTLQDIMIRYKRMQGFSACWMPGTDHAGIATQNVVEKQLAKEGKTRQDVGREALLERLWEWKKEYGDTIIHQLEKLGSSCDWPRTRFTMDDEYNEAVKHVFVSLYEKGLIYRGQYIINWCPRCQTALSDEEAEHKEIKGALYHIRYLFKDDPKKFVTVATTRPETMLGDTAVAVNPDDKRYKKLIGKTLVLPIINREIKIISDEFVSAEFGTGAVKVTPAHDPNDFEMGRRHNLEFINIMHPDAKLNKNAGPFAAQDRFAARKGVIEKLKELELLEKIEDHMHAVGHCYRCNTVIEPYLSKQWFVKMKPLAEPALKAAQEGKIKFYPERFTKVYLNWMENIRDWCISRQIWWGHRIPVWYCQNCPEPTNLIVQKEAPKKCPKCGGTKLLQDEDVLDTWFSSWLWPFATFYWPTGTPQAKKDLAYFYPTQSLFTASEIIFFWVARMIMAGIEFMGEVPFKDIYIHGTVRDAKGRKMSKSLGNAIDPLEIIEEYGADSLRFSLIINSGQDLFISKEKFEIGRNFANKIWNASRLVLMNSELKSRNIDLTKDIDLKKLDLPSRWIISRFYSTLRNVSAAIENFRYSEAENLIFEFFWGNFCDWYLEIVKSKFKEPDIQKIVFSILEQSIRMMHPFIPFVTEEIWQQLKVKEGTLTKGEWPKVQESLIDTEAEADMQTLTEIVGNIRNIKTQWNIKLNQDIDTTFSSTKKEKLELLKANAEILKFLLKIKNFNFDKSSVLKNVATGVVDHVKFSIPLGELIDIGKEKARIVSDIEQQKKSAATIDQRLKSEFAKKAPAEVVEGDRKRLDGLNAKIRELEATIKNLE